jgi:flagellar basal-body rod protein FlgF
MDRLIYLAASGASQLLNQHAATAHNLANATTTGYRADTTAFRAVPVQGDALATRTYVMDSGTGADFRTGPVAITGRNLDVAIEGKGWITVQLADGSEAYTRNGSLQFNENGVLQTRSGLTVMGDGGPITIPPDMQITVGKDGTVSTVPTNNLRNQVSPIGRIRLVNPPETELVRGGDGLFRLQGGGTADVDPSVKLVAGALEGSNVNVIDAMVGLISLSRQFESQMQLMQTAQNDAQQASKLLSLGA